MNSIEGLSNKGFSELVQWFDTRRVVQVCKIFIGLSDIRGCLVGFKKQKAFVLKTSFHTCKIACMRESVRTGHDIDIHIEICIFYMNVCEWFYGLCHCMCT